MGSFFKPSGERYCSYCGSFVGLMGKCRRCGHPRKGQYGRYCIHCGAEVEDGICTHSGAEVYVSVVEQVVRILCAAALLVSLLWGCVAVYLGTYTAVALLVVILAAGLWLLPSRQTYRIKAMLAKRGRRQAWIYAVYIAVLLLLAAGVAFSALVG